MSSLVISKSTPVLMVDAIEPCLSFWQERLGFERQVEMPEEEDRLGFVILTNGNVEVMYETVSMMRKDLENHAVAHNDDKTYLFIEVNDIDALAKALEGCELVMPRRVTAYGATEIGYREPGGHYVTFAQFGN